MDKLKYYKRASAMNFKSPGVKPTGVKKVYVNCSQETLSKVKKTGITSESLDAVYNQCTTEKQKYDIASSVFWTAAADKLLKNPDYVKPESKTMYSHYEDQIQRCIEILKSGDLKAIIQNINTFPNPHKVRDLLMARLNKKAELGIVVNDNDDKYYKAAVAAVILSDKNPCKIKVYTDQSKLNLQTAEGFKLQPREHFIEFKDMVCNRQRDLV